MPPIRFAIIDDNILTAYGFFCEGFDGFSISYQTDFYGFRTVFHKRSPDLSRNQIRRDIFDGNDFF